MKGNRGLTWHLLNGGHVKVHLCEFSMFSGLIVPMFYAAVRLDILYFLVQKKGMVLMWYWLFAKCSFVKI